MKEFRVFYTKTNETIIFIKMKDFYEASYWVFKNYGDVDTIDIEEVK